MKNWDEIRTALHVAQRGTVSGAADALGVHHATVIRHIDALEQQLGTKLFYRHPKGYTATEAGKELLQVAQVTEDQFAQLGNRLSGKDKGVTGELVVTSLAVLSPVLTPILAAFSHEHPNLSVRFLTGARRFRLEYGEAHVAIRAGAAPVEPDNVVQEFGSMPCGLYAAQSYIERYGHPKSESDMKDHGFVTFNGPTSAPFSNWMNEHIPLDRRVFMSSENQVLIDAIVAGAGIGFIPIHVAKRLPNLVPIMPPLDEWNAPLWLVTHMDMHRTEKVRSFVDYLKACPCPFLHELTQRKSA